MEYVCLIDTVAVNIVRATALEATVTVTMIAALEVDTGRVDWTAVTIRIIALIHVWTHSHTYRYTHTLGQPFH